MSNSLYRLKAFVSIPAFCNNTPGRTSPLGELSDFTKTYSREKGEYAKAALPNVKLISFTSKQDGSNEKLVVPARITDHVLSVSQWSFNHSISGDFSSAEDSYKNLLLGEYGNLIKNLEVGKMEQANGNWLPAYVKWQLDDGGAANELRIWFSNEAFKSQYDDYEIVVIPPIVPVDTFQKVRKEVEAALSKFNLPDHDDTVQETVGDDNPYTIRKTNDYLWHDREDADATLNTSWTVAIYGIAGNNPALIKDAIGDFILANSAYDKPDWIPVFPEIFTSTEFTILPLWHNIGVKDATVAASLYSPIVPYNEILPLAKKYLGITNSDHLTKYLSVQTLHYKSIAYLAVGGTDNRDNKYSLKDYFPDYILISPQSPDINRISDTTYNWLMMLTKALITAEEMDEYSFIGADLARIERDGRMHVGFEFDKVLYLVLARGSMDEVPKDPE